MGGDVLFAPLQWLGNSHHHMDFPGTLSAEPRAYLDLLTGELENFIQRGFKRLILLNGHGGNMVPGAVVFELRQKLRDRSDLLLLSTTYWENGDPNAARDDFVQTQMGHAGEWETSMMVVIRPSWWAIIRPFPRCPLARPSSAARAGRCPIVASPATSAPPPPPPRRRDATHLLHRRRMQPEPHSRLGRP